MFEPELAVWIQAKKPTHSQPAQFGIFVYYITRSNHVHRVWVEDYRIYGFGYRLTESSKYQQRLILAAAQQKITGYAEDPLQ